MHLSHILDTMRAEGTECFVEVGEDWGQGRATYGGLVAAAGNEAMRRLVPRDRVLRSLQTTFVGPAAPGDWTLSTRVLRVGRAVSSIHCEISVEGEVAAVLVGVYGSARPTRVEVPLVGSPPSRALNDLPEMLLGIDGSPRYVQHFSVRWIEGPGLLSGVRTPGKAFIRHRDPAPLTESHVVALADCLPPAAMSMYAAPAPASSLVWTLELVNHKFSFPSDSWWRIEHDMDAAKEGYANQTGLLYDPTGTPVALSRQLVAVFG